MVQPALAAVFSNADLVGLISSHLDVDAIVRCRLVSRSWRLTLESDACCTRLASRRWPLVLKLMRAASVTTGHWGWIRRYVLLVTGAKQNEALDTSARHCCVQHLVWKQLPELRALIVRTVLPRVMWLDTAPTPQPLGALASDSTGMAFASTREANKRDYPLFRAFHSSVTRQLGELRLQIKDSMRSAATLFAESLPALDAGSMYESGGYAIGIEISHRGELLFISLDDTSAFKTGTDRHSFAYQDHTELRLKAVNHLPAEESTLVQPDPLDEDEMPNNDNLVGADFRLFVLRKQDGRMLTLISGQLTEMDFHPLKHNGATDTEYQMSYWFTRETLVDGLVWNSDEEPTFARGYLRIHPVISRLAIDESGTWHERVQDVELTFGMDPEGMDGGRCGEPAMYDRGYDRGNIMLKSDDIIVMSRWTPERFDSLMKSLPGWA